MTADWAETAVRNPGWRRCAEHAGAPASWVCETCRIGLCEASVRRIGQAAGCPRCDGLCQSLAAAVFLAPGLLVFLAIGWAIAYLPMTLIVAAVTRSFVQTLNPVTGVQMIRILGLTYWEAMAI